MRTRLISKVFFEGPLGSLHAREMARGNRDAEQEAVDELAPGATDSVLVIGFGPGVGIRFLAERVTAGRIVGVDPSAAMVRHATRRNEGAIRDGRVALVRTTADDLPFDDETFDGAITVNTIQLWDPFERSVAEVARVLRPGARLVSFTHDWALRRFGGTTVEGWVRSASEVFTRHGLVGARSRPGRSEDGKIIAFTATRAG